MSSVATGRSPGFQIGELIKIRPSRPRRRSGTRLEHRFTAFSCSETQTGGMTPLAIGAPPRGLCWWYADLRLRAYCESQNFRIRTEPFTLQWVAPCKTYLRKSGAVWPSRRVDRNVSFAPHAAFQADPPPKSPARVGGSSPRFVPRSNVFRSQNYSLDPKAQITLCRARGKRRQMPPIAKSNPAFEETGNV